MEEQHNGPLNPQSATVAPVTGSSVESDSASTIDSGQAETKVSQAEPTVQSQPGQTQQTYQLPPGYVFDPATGQVFFVGPAMPQPAQPQQPTAEQVAAQQAASGQRYGQVINSVEQFLEGEATVSDVVKTLYMNTAQDDQLWKGIIVGAAAAFLLTSEPVRDAMGKTLRGVLPGLKKESSLSTGTEAHTYPESTTKKE